MIDQIAIGVCGVSAVFCSQSEALRVRRLACLFGLVGQPFWLYATWQAQQGGIFALAFVYTCGWWRGFRLHWWTRGKIVRTREL